MKHSIGKSLFLSVIVCLSCFEYSYGQLNIPATFKKISSVNPNLTTIPDGAFFGTSVTTLGDLNGDGFTDIAVGSTRKGTAFFGAVRILFLDSNNDVISAVTLATQGLPEFEFGSSVRGIGDLDKDGINDMAVGASYDGDGGYQHGAVWILFLHADGTIKASQKISSLSGGFTEALVNLSSFGSSIANMGDLDGDGNTDIAVGAYRDNGTNLKTGSVFLLYLNSNGTVKKSIKIGGGLDGFTPTLNFEDYFGGSVANLGDLDRDGVTDLAIGAHRTDDGATDAGGLWILFLNSDGTVKSFQKISSSAGNFDGTLHYEDLFGDAIENVGDLDGDGVTDIAVGASMDNDGGTHRGAVWILNLTPTGFVKASTKISRNSGGTNLTLNDDDNFGRSIANLGDVNGDKILDIVIGSFGDDDGGSNRGALWITGLNCSGVDAGTDVIICDGVNQIAMDAQADGRPGMWNVLQGTGTFENGQNPQSSVSNLSIGLNSFVWILTSQPNCRDTVNVEVYQSPSPPNAGDDQILCDKTQAELNATPVSVGFGRWSSGPNTQANIVTPDLPTTTVNGLALGINIFIWETFSGNQCASLKDTLIILASPGNLKSFAGEDVTLCNETMVSLNAHAPDFGSGRWEIIEGQVKLDNPQDPKTKIEVQEDGEIKLRWIVEDGICAPDLDEVTINVLSYPGDEFYNVITPDSNGKNDFWIVENLDQLPGAVELKIVNRWGRLVFETPDYKNNWDAKDLGAGVYFFQLNIAACKKEVKGWIRVVK